MVESFASRLVEPKLAQHPYSCEKSKYVFDESFYGHYCPRQKAPPPLTVSLTVKCSFFDAFFREAVKNYFAFFGKMIFR